MKVKQEHSFCCCCIGTSTWLRINANLQRTTFKILYIFLSKKTYFFLIKVGSTFETLKSVFGIKFIYLYFVSYIIYFTGIDFRVFELYATQSRLNFFHCHHIFLLFFDEFSIKIMFISMNGFLC